MYILESLFGAPPVTLATRRRASSAFRSFNWVSSSVLDLFLNSWTLILAKTLPTASSINQKINEKHILKAYEKKSKE